MIDPAQRAPRSQSVTQAPLGPDAIDRTARLTDRAPPPLSTETSPAERAQKLALGFAAIACLVCAARTARGQPTGDETRSEEPAEVVVRGQRTQAAASEITVSHDELATRPRMRAEEVLEAVPGLFTVQHSGGAKAQQYFLRGFDADHGTDIAFSVDGMPINFVSHAHGQGYTDLHFLIPELVFSVDGAKGPYSARAGDFATAGSVNLRLLDQAPESYASAELGPYGRARGLVVDSPKLDDSWRAIVAAEVFTEDGPFVHPQGNQRFTGYARVTRVIDSGSELAFTWMGYGASWNASGLLPVRAICDGGSAAPCVGRFDSLDPTQGGESQRNIASLAYHLRRPQVEVHANAYVQRSTLALFVNDTLASSIEQDDDRTVLGTSVHVIHRSRVGGVELDSTLGLQGRSDLIDNATHDQQGRRRLDALVASRISETALGAFAEEVFRPAHWLRFAFGARADRVDIAVDSADSAAALRPAGVRAGGLVSPKWAAVVSPLRGVDLFANYGRGFHSNDARGVVAGGATLLAVATGYELGVKVEPLRHLTLSAAAFLLDITSELVFNADNASTLPSGATRREGIELIARYRLRRDIFADAALTLTHARYRADDGSGTYVPLAPARTFAAGIGVREPIGSFTAFGALRVKSISDRPATRDGALVAEGFTLVDAQAGVRYRCVELAVDVFNALDAAWREGQFAVTSRLPWEQKPVTAMSMSPGWPREVMGQIRVYW